MGLNSVYMCTLPCSPFGERYVSILLCTVYKYCCAC